MSTTLVKNEEITDTFLEENKLIHEHDFVTIRLDGDTNCYLIQCMTCSQYFCQTCGKALLTLSSRPMSINLKTS